MKKKSRQNLDKIIRTAQKRSGRVQWVIGIDEVGRGPIAGPVTVCACAVRVAYVPDFEKMGFRDSKKLSPQKREQFAQVLHNCAQLDMCKWAIADSSSEIIDTRGIVYAIQNALDRCMKKLAIHPEHADIYLDGGLRAHQSYFRQHTVIHGDDLFPVISCASILAKVYRDHMMQRYDTEYPEYGFIDNKGYGTAGHYRAIKKHGTSPLHRQSFLYVKNPIKRVF